MRKFTILTGMLVLGAGPVLAHPGHLGTLAGHDHWVAGAAIAAAVLIGLWAALKGGGGAAGEDEADSEEAGTESGS
ncbi:MAG: DUF6732 family protein [Paracoccaceae bacterium]